MDHTLGRCKDCSHWRRCVLVDATYRRIGPQWGGQEGSTFTIQEEDNNGHGVNPVKLVSQENPTPQHHGRCSLDKVGDAQDNENDGMTCGWSYEYGREFTTGENFGCVHYKFKGE